MELLLAAAAAPAAVATAAAQAQVPSTSRIVHRQPLQGRFDGMDAAFVEVTIPAGQGSPLHRHSGFVLGYVLEGEFRFGINGQTPRVLKAGEVFYEPAGAVHSSSASASPDRPARILAIIVGPAGEQVTTYETAR